MPDAVPLLPAHGLAWVPTRSVLDQGTKGMRTPLNWDAGQKAWVATLTVPFKLLPLSLAMVLFFPGAAVCVALLAVHPGPLFPGAPVCSALLLDFTRWPG